MTSYALVRSGRADRFDDAVAGLVRRPFGPAADTVVGAATDLGSVFGLTGAAAMLATTGRRRAAADVLGSGLIAWCLAQGAKPLIERSRPYQSAAADRLVAEPMGSSWPSGHAAVSAAMATVVSDHDGRAATAAGVGLVGFVAASRVYVGVHHASDPVAGAGIGVISAAAWSVVRGLVGRRRRRGRRS